MTTGVGAGVGVNCFFTTGVGAGVGVNVFNWSRNRSRSQVKVAGVRAGVGVMNLLATGVGVKMLVWSRNRSQDVSLELEPGLTGVAHLWIKISPTVYMT